MMGGKVGREGDVSPPSLTASVGGVTIIKKIGRM
jgi:hypothetical protein